MFISIFKWNSVPIWASLVAQLVKNLPAMKETPVQFLGREDSWRIGYPLRYCCASLVAQMIKKLPAMQETWVQSLGWEDPPGEGNGNPLHYCCLENSKDRGAWQSIVHGVAKSQTQLSYWVNNSSHRTGKGQCSFQSQRKAMPKIVQTTAYLHSFHTLAK